MLVVLFVLTASAQASLPGNRHVVRHFGSGYGIPPGINTVVRTQDGYLWLGTFGGLYRFDGSKATRFQVQRPGKTRAGSGPGSDRITVLHEDTLGRLWIGTQDAGLTLYQRGKFQLLPLCGGTCHIKGLAESPGKDIWVATNKGLMRIDAQTIRGHYLADAESGTYDSVVIGSDGSIHASGNKGMGKVVGDRIQKMDPPRRPVWPGWEMQSIAGTLWAQALDGSDTLHSFDAVTGQWQHAEVSGQTMASADGHLWINTHAGELLRAKEDRTFEKMMGLPTMRVTSVLPGGGGLYWVSSSEGLWSVQVERDTLVEPDAAGIPYPGRAVAEDDREGTWLGFSCGGLRYLPPQGSPDQLEDNPQLKNQCVTTLLNDQAGGLWVGTMSELVHLSDRKTLRIPLPEGANSAQIWRAEDDGLWVGVELHTYALNKDEQGNYALSPPITVLEGMSIRKMRDARRGGIWFVGDQGAFRLLNGKLVEKWTLAEGLSSRFARTIHEDDTGTWIGTYGGGLNLIRQGKVHIYDESNGLFDNTVSCIEADGSGRLWLGGNKGISVLPKPHWPAPVESVPVKVSADSTSFEVNGGMQSSCFRDSKGRLWFSLVQGFLTLDPDDYRNVKSAVPVVHIERVSSAGGTLDAANRRITMDPRTANVQIEYTGINLLHPGLLSYRYRLSSQSAEWTYTRTGRNIRYENIAWGEHLFEVQARNQGGNWSESAQFRISRPAPWYQRQWLWPLVSVCSLMLLVWRTRARQTNDWHRERVKRIMTQNGAGLEGKAAASSER